MIALAVALLFAAQEPSVQDRVDALIERLDADDPAAREEAEAALREIGFDAIEPLRRHEDDPRPEVRARVVAILESLTADRDELSILPPSPRLTLQADGMPLSEFLAEVERQTGWHGRAQGVDESAPITLEARDEPAIAALYRATDQVAGARLMVAGWMPIPARAGEVRPDFVLAAGSASRLHLEWHGFRVSLNDLILSSYRSWNNRQENATIQIEVTGPPEAAPCGPAGLIFDEVVDDQGRALTSESGILPARGGESDAVKFLNPNAVAAVQGSNFRPPESDARSLSILRGRIRLEYPVERIRQTFRVEDLTPSATADLGPWRMTVETADPRGNEFSATVRVEFAAEGRAPSWTGGVPIPRFLDAAGEEIDAQQMSSSVSMGDGCTYTGLFRFPALTSPLAALRFDAAVGTRALTIPFEFRDVPLPPP